MYTKPATKQPMNDAKEFLKQIKQWKDERKGIKRVLYCSRIGLINDDASMNRFCPWNGAKDGIIVIYPYNAKNEECMASSIHNSVKASSALGLSICLRTKTSKMWWFSWP